MGLTHPSRRALVLGGLGLGAAGVAGVAVGVEQGALPGATRVRAGLGLNGEPGRVPDAAPGRVVHGSFVSRARGGVRTGWSVAYPPGGASGLPVLVVLHGLGGDHRAAMSPNLGMDRFLAAGVKAGRPPFAIASVDGGTTYWHRRSDGEDAGAMVLEEFVPLQDLADIPVRIDCGTGDPFYGATREYVDGFPRSDRPTVHFDRGAHDMGYWRRMAPAQLRFVARHLA